MEKTCNIPLRDLIKLYNSVEAHDKNQAEIIRLRKEVEGLRSHVFDTISIIQELRKERGR